MARRIVLSSAGLLISKLGKDALSGNPSDLLLDATRQNSRFALKGTVTGTITYTRVGDYAQNVAGYEYYIPHNLGYIPHFRGQNIGSGGKIMIDATNVILAALQTYATGSPPPTTIALPNHNAYYEVFYDRWV